MKVLGKKILVFLAGMVVGLCVPATFVFLDLNEIGLPLTGANIVRIIQSQLLQRFGLIAFPVLFGALGILAYANGKKLQSLAESERRYRALFDNAIDIIYTVSVDGRLTSANSAFEQVTGDHAEWWIGKGFSELLASEERVRWAGEYKEILQGARIGIRERRLVPRSGKQVHLEYAETVQTQEGRVVGVLGIARDITKQKNTEREKEKISRELAHAAKLAHLGTLCSGVAHELNNPLTSVKGFADVIQQSEEASADIKEMAGLIKSSAQRMEGITSYLRTFSRRAKASDWKPVNLNEIVRESLTLLQTQLSLQGVKVELILAPQLPPVWGDTSALQSVFQNLLTNSRDAFLDLSDDRKKCISIATVESKEHGVDVIYEDNAGGIPAPVKEHLFQPFFTTKEEGKGTGLGLSIIHGIVEDHKGGIQLAESPPGKGTTFVLTFPLDRRAKARGEAPAPDAQEPASVPSAPPGNLRSILVIDDEDSIGLLLKRYLKDEFEVVFLNNPKQALAEIGLRRYDLIVTDLKMPEVSGIGILFRAKETQPETPVVVISGHADMEKETRNIVAQGARAVLGKPFGTKAEVIQFFKAQLAAEGAKKAA